MSVEAPFVVGDGPAFVEALRADANTVRARQWASDLFASHAALKSAVWEMYGDRLKECFGIDAAKIVAEGFETMRALVDASGRDDSESLHIRFHCAAWMAQQFKSRALFPKGASDEEKKRMRARLTRQWARTGWSFLHLMQCATGLPFFRRDVVAFDANRGRDAAVYENGYTDLLLDVRRRARAFRRKHTVWRYEQAAREALRAYIERKDVRHYAPDWRPEQPDAPPPEAGSDDEEDSPTVKVENIALRSAARAAKIAAQLPDEERDACAVLFFERAVETWEKETGRVFPYVPPVLRRADNEKNSDPTSCTRGHIEDCDFPAKNEDLPTPSVDKLSAVDALEFEADEEPRGVSFADADGAATACASVGIETVKVVFIDDTKPRGAPDACTLAEELSLAEFQDRLPAFLERNRASAVESFTVRLRRKEDTRLIQIDDCSREVLDLIKPFVFLAFQTSPGNWQAWLCLADALATEDYDDARRRLLTFLKPTGANGGAYGASRWPGSRNNKPKRRYADGEAPRVALSYVALGRKVSVAEMDAAGLLAAPRPKPTAADVRAIMSRLPDPNDWPDMNQYLAECDGDRSRAESKWCVRALGMGHPRSAVESELERIGEKARIRRRDNYVRETVEKAAQWVGMNPRREVASATRPAPSTERVRGTI